MVDIAGGVLIGALIPLGIAGGAAKFLRNGKPFTPAITVPLMSTFVFLSLVSLIDDLPTAGDVRDPGDILAAPGVSMQPFIESTLFRPTALAIDSSDRLYIATNDSGVFRAVDTDGDSVADEVRELANVGDLTLGVATVDGTEVFISNAGSIYLATDNDLDGRAESVKEILSGLPARVFGAHSTNNLAIGPDGRVYVGVGGTSDQGPEEYEFGGTVASFEPDGSDLTVYAAGFRNPYGVSFSEEGLLLVTDNAPDAVTERVSWEPPAELNLVTTEGGNFGYPNHYGFPPAEDPGYGPVALFQNTDVPTGVAHYVDGQLPSDFADTALVTLWGSRQVSSLAAVSMQDIRAGNVPAKVKTVATGFGNAISTVIDSQGRVFVADFSAHTIYVMEDQ